MDQPAHSELERRADEAAARGTLDEAIALLDRAAEAPGAHIGLHLKRAGLRRGLGMPQRALAALSDALALDPLDFTALLMRASLLDQAGSAEAGEAYGRAIAQAPDGPLPPPVAQALSNARRRHDEHLAALDDSFARAMAGAEASSSAEEKLRMRRFRSNALRRTRVFHSEPTHYHYPGLVEREFHDVADFDWIELLQTETPAIRAEMEALLASTRAELVPYVRYPKDVPLRQWEALNHSRAWTAVHLLKDGARVPGNADACPRTMAALARIPQPDVPGRSPNAMFSLLAPRTRIPPHTGVANTRLVCHLPLVVPPDCWFRVGAETREWREGEAFVFDDTIEHEAANDGDRPRVVLIFDVWHPGLAPVEREAVGAMMAGDALTDAAL